MRRLRKSPAGRNGGRRKAIESIRRRWIQNRLTVEGMDWARSRGWNDTYTYTKAIGEQMVLRCRGDMPTVILRPSVIESSLSEPSPGWLDGLRMADPLIAAIGKGRLRSLPLKPHVLIDLVPVDMVVNALLASLPRAAERGGLHCYQVATGSTNPITLGQLYDLIYRYFTRNPMQDRSGRPIRIRRLRFPRKSLFRLQHRLQALPLGAAARALEKLPALAGAQRLRRRISATRAAHQRLYGFVAEDEPIQLVTFRAEATGIVRKADIRPAADAGPDPRAAEFGRRDVWLRESGAFVSCPLYDRERLAAGNRIEGPAIVEQMDATTLIVPGATATVDPYLNLMLELP